MRSLLLPLLLSSLLLSCGPVMPKEEREALITQIYERRVADKLVQVDSECKADALEAAEAHVDSVVHKMLNVGLVDTINFPRKPVKPLTPDHIIGTVHRDKIQH